MAKAKYNYDTNIVSSNAENPIKVYLVMSQSSFCVTRSPVISRTTFVSSGLLFEIVL